MSSSSSSTSKVETRGCELPERRSKQQNGLDNVTAFLVEGII